MKKITKNKKEKVEKMTIDVDKLMRSIYEDLEIRSSSDILFETYVSDIQSHIQTINKTTLESGRPSFQIDLDQLKLGNSSSGISSDGWMEDPCDEYENETLDAKDNIEVKIHPTIWAQALAYYISVKMPPLRHYRIKEQPFAQSGVPINPMTLQTEFVQIDIRTSTLYYLEFGKDQATLDYMTKDGYPFTIKITFIDTVFDKTAFAQSLKMYPDEYNKNVFEFKSGYIHKRMFDLPVELSFIDEIIDGAGYNKPGFIYGYDNKKGSDHAPCAVFRNSNDSGIFRCFYLPKEDIETWLNIVGKVDEQLALVMEMNYNVLL